LAGLLLVAGVTATAWMSQPSQVVPTKQTPPALEDLFGGKFSLTDQLGRSRTDRDFLGKYLMLSFGYTFCPDVCPTTLQDITIALKELGDDAAQLQPVFVTVDPMRDTSEVLAEYVKLFDPRLVGLTGTEAQIRDISKKYRVHRVKVPIDNASVGGYLVDHSSLTFLMAPDGSFLTFLPYGTDGYEIARRVRTYLDAAKTN